MSADLLRRLIEAGTPAELVAEVADRLADARAAERVLEARRSKDRERKRVPQNSRNSTEAEESAEFRATPSLDKEAPQTPKEIKPIPYVRETRARGQFQPPEGVTEEQFRAFRQQRKKALTPHAYTLLCNKLKTLAEDGWPPGDMIDLAIERGWETVFEPKDQTNGRGQANLGSGGTGAQRMGGPRPDPTLALVRAAVAAQRQDA